MCNNYLRKGMSTEIKNEPSKNKKGESKYVRNRSGHRVELVNGGKVSVFLPGKITEVPVDFEMPNGLGLYVR